LDLAIFTAFSTVDALYTSLKRFLPFAEPFVTTLQIRSQFADDFSAICLTCLIVVIT